MSITAIYKSLKDEKKNRVIVLKLIPWEDHRKLNFTLC